MKGAIAGSFVGWMENTRGLTVADAVITACEPDLSTGGAYTTVGDYPAAEFRLLVDELARREGTSSETVMREFGRDAYGVLAGMHPELTQGMPDLASLLTSIEDVIHADVRKLYAHSQPPLIRAVELPHGQIEVTYRSHRHLTPLCHGLIEGAVAHFGGGQIVEVIEETLDGDDAVARFLVRSAA